MKKRLFILQLILLPLLFTGCELGSIFGPSKKEIELKQRELALQEQELKFNQELKLQVAQQNHLLKTQQNEAKIEQEKAQLQTTKEIELEKIKSSFEKEKLEIQKQELEGKNKEKDLQYSISKQENDLKFNLSKQEKQNEIEMQKYLVVFATLLFIVIAVSLFIYFNNRRKDKLRAYEDNLDKYFREKENQAKLEIANKILDTIASGNLTHAQENKLIATINSDSKTSDKALLQNHTKDKDIHDVEVMNENNQNTDLDKNQEKKS